MQAATEALKGAGCVVEPVRIPALEQDNALDVFYRLHVMELKPAFLEATAGRNENELFKIAKAMLARPDTALDDFVLAEQAAERLKDGFAEYFKGYDALLCPVLPIRRTSMVPQSSSSTAEPCPPDTFQARLCRST